MRELPLQQNLIGHYPLATHALLDLVRGVSFGMRNRSPLPSLDVVPVRFPDTFGGRYFPAHNAIVVYGAHDPDVLHATIIHEAAHWRTYVEHCGAPSARGRKLFTGRDALCTYKGDHDAAFYAVLGPLYRSNGASREAIQTVEGDYAYPSSLLRGPK